MTVFRVVKTTTNDFGPYNGKGPQRVDTDVIWEGSDIDELSRAYPPSQIFGADPLGHSEIEDGLIRFDYTFEMRGSVGWWKKISDPRRRITPTTEAEREQDAENRRLYPGDYITEDEYCNGCGRDAGDCMCSDDECEHCGSPGCGGGCLYEDDYSDEEYDHALED